MTDAFASLVGPVFQHVIEIQQRQARGESPALEVERQQILALLAEAEQKAGASSQLAHDFELARHALVYWIDEVLVNSASKDAMEWRQRIIEFDIYRERLRANRFFEKAAEAEALAGTDPLETFFLGVALGFRGEPPQLDQAKDVPSALRNWSRRVYNRIAASNHQPDRFLPDEPHVGEPLRALPGTTILLAVSLLVALTALFTLACFVLAVPPWD